MSNDESAPNSPSSSNGTFASAGAVNLVTTPMPSKIVNDSNDRNGPIGSTHRFKKIHSGLSLSSNKSKIQLVNNYWDAVYNPLPYGGPRSSVQLAEEVENTFRLKQASGLPVARTGPREKEREQAELKLPIPDSEIASPGHYRQPFDRDQVKAHHESRKYQSANSRRDKKKYPANRTVNIEAFRILMDVIRSLRDLGIPENSTPVPSTVTASSSASIPSPTTTP